MKPSPVGAFFAILGIACFSFALAFGPQPQRKPPKANYASVAPIFKGCAMCHGGKHPQHGLDLSSYAKVMKGDGEGKVVIPGKPASSRLSKAVHRKGAAAMPPGRALPAADVAKIDAWIKEGAKEK